MARSSDSDDPPSREPAPETADEPDSTTPGLGPVPLDVPLDPGDHAPGADLDPVPLDPEGHAPDRDAGADPGAAGGPGPRRDWRRRGLAAMIGGVALMVVAGAALLVVSNRGGRSGTAAFSTRQAATGTSQAGVAAGQSPQSAPLVPASQAGVPASQAGALPPTPNAVTATGPGGTSGTPPTHPGRAAGTTAGAVTTAGAPRTATKPTAIGNPSSQTQAAPAGPGTSGELSPLAEPPASPTNSANPVPPVTADRTVTVSAGPAIVPPAPETCPSGVVCYSFRVSIANFPANADLAHTCADAGGLWWGPSRIVNSGNNMTNSSGDASFVTYCVRPLGGGTVTIDVGAGGLCAAGSYTG